MIVLGIDIGGTGIKGAPVNIKTGKLVKERFRLDTPKPATPRAIAATVAKIAKHFKWKGPIGCTFPAVVKDGVLHTAANVDRSWIGKNARTLIKNATGCKTFLLNDADAAGLAEVRFGAGKNKRGAILVVTLGTGIGSALFYDGWLFPNTELGHIIIRGRDAETRVSERARETKDLSWKKWGKNVSEYLETMHALLQPDMFILGGGVSKQFDKYKKFLKVPVPVVPAKTLNEAGIIGAALAAAESVR